MKIFTTLIVALFLITGCSKQEKKEAAKKSEIKQEQKIATKEAQNRYVLKDADGKEIEVELKDNRLITKDNKVILLDFFATWCPPCRAEIPHLVNLQEKYKDKIKIIGILLNRDRNPNEIKDFIEKHKINYFVSISNDNFDLAKKMYSLAQAPSDMPIPFMVMFKDSKYFIHYIGAVPEEMIESDIKQAIGE